MRSWANLVGGDKEEKGLPHANENGPPRVDAEGHGRALTKAQASAAPGRCTAFAVRTPAHARALASLPVTWTLRTSPTQRLGPHSAKTNRTGAGSSHSLTAWDRRAADPAGAQVTAEAEAEAAICAQNVDEEVEGWLHGRRYRPIRMRMCRVLHGAR